MLAHSFVVREVAPRGPISSPVDSPPDVTRHWPKRELHLKSVPYIDIPAPPNLVSWDDPLRNPVSSIPYRVYQIDGARKVFPYIFLD